MSGYFEWDFKFIINPDNSIQGSATAKGTLQGTSANGSTSGAPAGTAKIQGQYDSGSNNVELVFELEDVQGLVNAVAPNQSATGEMQWTPTDLQMQAPGADAMISSILHNLVGTFEEAGGQSITVSRPAGLTTADNTWQYPPIPKQDGYSESTNSVYPGGIAASTVTKLYQSITIERQDEDDQTFIAPKNASQGLSFEVVVKEPGYDPNTACWEVDSDSQFAGAPNPSNPDNTSSFSFQPTSKNPATCSRSPNPPLQYKLKVTVGDLTATTELIQDEIDTQRQEYIDFDAGVLDRNRFVLPINPTFNTGNYAYILDGDLQQHYDAVTTQFGTMGGVGGLGINSAYRNPRRNECSSIEGIKSHHCWGTAIDLKPAKYDAPSYLELHQGGAAVCRVSFCEHEHGTLDHTAHHIDTTGLPAGQGVDHVHVQW